MKKLVNVSLIILFYLIFLTNLMSCSGEGPSTDSVEEEAISTRGHTENQEKPVQDKIRERLQLTSDILEVHTLDLPEMIKSRKVRVLTTYNFLNYFVDEGQAFGYEYSLMEEYKKFLNKGRSRRDLQIEFYYIPLPYDLLIPALNKGYGIL